MKVFVIDNSFVRFVNGNAIEGEVAYDEKGEVLLDGVGCNGGVIKRLLDQGYNPEQIYVKRFVPLSEKSFI